MLEGTKQVERNFENLLFLVEVAHIAPPPPPKKKKKRLPPYSSSLLGLNVKYFGIFLVCKKELTLRIFSGIIT